MMKIKTVREYCNSRKCLKWTSHKIIRRFLGGAFEDKYVDIECSNCWVVKPVEWKLVKKTNLRSYVE